MVRRLTPKRILIVVLVVASVLLVGWWFDLHHRSVEEMTHLHGEDETTVVAALGQPTKTHTWTLEAGKTLPEKYIEVHNTYHPDNPAADGVQIKELTWDRIGYTISLFLHQVNGEWIVLESVRYKDGVQF